jgi:hypothetical protein
VRATSYFSRDVHSFWGTTFQFDLKFFDQFLLRQLAKPPMNGVVLCDEDCLHDALWGLTATDRHVADSANSRYLLRGLRLQGGGRFHPKTYLFASRRNTTLLVGSGNLTRSGVDRGNEVFVGFDADGEGASVLAAWMSWIGGLVEEQNDRQLTRRYQELRASLPDLPSAAQDGTFFVNADQSVVDRIAEVAPRAVTDLHATAPYYDKPAEALSELVRTVRPSGTLHLYLAARTNVDGGALASTLRSLPCDVTLHRYEPAQFVHAKLIGLTGKNEGVLVCGSANLSRAALTYSYEASDSPANCEAVAMRCGDSELVRAAFHPPNIEVVDANLDELDALTFAENEEDGSHAFPFRLLSVELGPDRRARVRCEPEPNGASLTWEDADAPLPIESDSVSGDPLDDEDDPVVVWLVDQHGKIASNAVVLDDPVALDEALREAGRDSNVPRELEGLEGRSQLTELLRWAHENFVFDIDETPAAQRTANAQEVQPDAEDAEFWERYQRSELEYDPRSQTYRRLPGSGLRSPIDLLLMEIEAMMRAAPGEQRRLRLVRDETDEGGEREAGQGVPWSLGARERLRARNLLKRWCHAVADPRHAWMSPDAPLRNYEALLEVLTMIWLTDALGDDDRIIDLLGDLWAAFIGSDDSSGFLGRADDALRAEALSALSDDTGGIAAGLAFTALSNDRPWTAYIYDWQPFLTRGLNDGVFRPTEIASDLVEVLSGSRPTNDAIALLLRERSTYIDDRTWGERIAEELGLQKVEVLRAFNPNVKLAVRVEGASEPARDARLLTVARRAMELKESDSVMVVAGEQRLRLQLGEVTSARVDGMIRKSTSPMTATRLAAVESQGGSFAELIGPALAA